MELICILERKLRSMDGMKDPTSRHSQCPLTVTLRNVQWHEVNFEENMKNFPYGVLQKLSLIHI